MSLIVDVTGTPAPQGSKKGFYNQAAGRVQMVESSKKVAPWRQDVVAAVLNAIAEDGTWVVPAGPVTVELCFFLTRPRYHFRTGKNANLLREDAPVHVDKKPDIDKLARATLDALTTSGAIKDDAQVARLTCEKRYSSGRTGARIVITPLNSVAASTALGTSGAADVATVQEALL